MKIYTTAKELVKPTVRHIVRQMRGASNGGMELKKARKAVLNECKPIFTIIDGHYGNSKIRMIERTFNNMIYGGALEKSGYAIYSKQSKEICPTEKAIAEFGENVRLTQLDLVIPAITTIQHLVLKNGSNKVKSVELLAELDKLVANTVHPTDLEHNVRKEPRYRQVIRNLVSHRVLDKTGIVKYHSETKEFELIVKPIAA